MASPVCLSDIVSDHRCECNTCLRGSRGRPAGKLLEIVDKRRHVLVAQSVFGHDRTEGAAVRVDPLPDGRAQGTFPTCRTEFARPEPQCKPRGLSENM